MPTLGAPLDFAKLEGRNLRIHQLSTAPSSPVEGQEYYNTTDHTFYWWDGTLWQAAKGGAPGGPAGGDLSGTYPNPQILANTIVLGDCNASMTDQIAGTASLRTLGTGATQACAGNDTRLTDSRAPTGAAGGDLLGSTYPNPVIAALAVTDAKVAAANKDGAVGTFSMRTLGYTGNAAMPGVARLDQVAQPAANLAMNNFKITGLADPTNPGDAVTKNYVDAAAQNLDVKASCRAASTANITIAGPGATIDGVTMVVNDRFLAKDQTTQTQNGIYVWNGAAVAATRATDADVGGSDVTAGMYTFIEEGTVNADSGWILTTNNPISLGTTSLVFTQFSGAGQITAGAGMTKTGNTLDVVGTTNRITVAADSVDIAATYVGQASITTVGNIASGSWQATPVAVAYGGTAATAPSTARVNLGAAGYYSSATHGAGTTISISAATHGLTASRGLLVQCQIEATGAVILPDISVAALGDVTITFSVSQSANTIRTTIIG